MGLHKKPNESDKESGDMSSSLEKQIKKKRAKFAPVAGAGGTSVASEHIMPTDDVRKVPNQRFTVVSYACPNGITRVCSPRGMVMKFSGSFSTQALAEEHANIIRNEDPRFDVFVLDMYVWGQVPLPEDEKPFVPRHYVEDMITRIVSGMQHSMVQGKKELDERKMRDRKKAEEAMRRVKGSDYVMPEKSKLLEKYETDVRKERENEEKNAKIENRDKRIMYDEDILIKTIMDFCVKNLGNTIGVSTGSEFIKFLVNKTTEREAQRRQTEDREKNREDEHPDAIDAEIERRKKAALEEQGDGYQKKDE